MEHCVGRVVVGYVGGLVALAIFLSWDHSWWALDFLDVSLVTIQLILVWHICTFSWRSSFLILRWSRVATVFTVCKLFSGLVGFLVLTIQLLWLNPFGVLSDFSWCLADFDTSVLSVLSINSMGIISMLLNFVKYWLGKGVDFIWSPNPPTAFSACAQRGFEMSASYVVTKPFRDSGTGWMVSVDLWHLRYLQSSQQNSQP